MKQKIQLALFTGMILFTLVSSAQPDAGTLTIGGGLSLDFQNNKQENGSITVDQGNTNVTSFTPLIGYFFLDGFAGGLAVNYIRSRFKTDDDTETTINRSFTVGPFLKYYHESGFFGMANIGFGSGKFKFEDTEFPDNNTEADRSVTDWRIGGGYAYFFNDHISIEPMISYGGQTAKFDGTDIKDINNSFRFSVGFALFLD
ncbi:MAG: outer membrane beta-barrel protein [Bacteroidota bacterium]